MKADLLGRLDRVCAHLPADQREALAAEMTRLRVRVDYGWHGGVSGAGRGAPPAASG